MLDLKMCNDFKSIYPQNLLQLHDASNFDVLLNTVTCINGVYTDYDFTLLYDKLKRDNAVKMNTNNDEYLGYIKMITL